MTTFDAAATPADESADEPAEEPTDGPADGPGRDASWDPAQYAVFGDHRGRPFHDLMSPKSATIAGPPAAFSDSA